MAQEPTHVTGGCLCGTIRYEAQVFLKNGYICHCTICQRSTGQPAELTVPIRAGTLRYLTEEPKYYVSSEHGKRGFCPRCGSRLVWQALSPDDDWLTNVTVGSLDRPSEARVKRHIFVDTRLPWYDACANLPTFKAEDLDRLVRILRQELTPEE